MNRLFIIIKREYVQMVCKKSFIITTLLVPILSVVLCGVLPMMMSQTKSADKKTVAVIDQNPDSPFASCVCDNDEYHFTPIVAADSSAENLHQLYTEHKDQEGGLYALVVIAQDFVQTPCVTIFSENSVNASLERTVNYSLRDVVRKNRIAAYNIDSLETIIMNVEPSIKISNIKWNEDGGETISSSELSMIIGLILAMLTYMFVIIYGAMIMNSVVEEKTNRIVEVIISTCKPMELMMGKIIGVALVGLTQIALWSVLIGVIGAIFGISTMAATGMPAVGDTAALQAAMEAQQGDGEFVKIMQMVMSVNYGQILTCFVLYFIGGYLLYASLFAAFGSAVDQASDASQYTGPIMMIMIFALYAGMFSMENPDGPLAVWCSMIPFTSPVVMMIRLPYELPWYQLVGSIAILYATALGIIWLASRIYRTGILMYGRKFTIKEILRWIKQ